jgi:hypothetical protein
MVGIPCITDSIVVENIEDGVVGLSYVCQREHPIHFGCGDLSACNPQVSLRTNRGGLCTAIPSVPVIQ